MRYIVLLVRSITGVEWMPIDGFKHPVGYVTGAPKFGFNRTVPLSASMAYTVLFSVTT